MLRLNIPISNNQSTRPKLTKGRVLWILISLVSLFLVPFILAKLWFTRDTLSSYAPEGTVAVIHLTPSRQAWTKIINDFNNLPIISERSLTIKDLATLKTNEISIFLLEDNKSAVAIKTQEKNLQREMLSSYGISIQKIGSNRWLLSNGLLPYSTESKTSWSFKSIWPKTIGTVYLDNFLGQIKINKNGYSVSTPNIKKITNLLPNLPESVTAAVSFQPELNIDLSSAFERFDTLLGPLQTIKSGEIAQRIKENGGSIILTNNGFLIETVFESSFLSQIIQIASAFQNPITKDMPMPDGSVVKEMFIDKTGANFESVWINGSEAKSVTTENGYFLAFDGEKTDILTSDKTLLEEYLNKKSEKISPVCDQKKILAYLKPNDFENGVIGRSEYTTTPNLFKFSEKFEEIVLTGNKMYFCY